MNVFSKCNFQFALSSPFIFYPSAKPSQKSSESKTQYQTVKKKKKYCMNKKKKIFL